jgi:hypothetical protein
MVATLACLARPCGGGCDFGLLMRGPQKYGLNSGAMGILVGTGLQQTKGVGLLGVLLKQRIKAEVSTKPGKIIRIGKADVFAMLNNHTPAHKSHLQAED